MRLSSCRRSGLALAEVLIAIFTLALGLLGILSLFPLAAANMATAIKDENSAQINQSSSALIRTIWKDETPYPPAMYVTATPSPTKLYDPILNAMTDVNFAYNPDLMPGGGSIPYPSAVPALVPPNVAAGYSLPSYPVFVDPVGWNNLYNLGTAQQFWLAGSDPTVAASNYLTIPRRSWRQLEWVPNPLTGATFTNPNPYKNTMINRFCFRLDDIGFGKDGTPYNSSTDPTQTSGVLGAALMQGEIQRDGRYSCGFMLKRRANNLVREADLTMVVYSGRSIDGPSVETAFQQTTFVQGSTEAVVTYAGDKPKIRKGTWILDATMVKPVGAALVPDPHGFFYRIISVNDDTPGVLYLELQVPAQKSTILPTGQAYGVGIVMDGVIEVFERGTLSQFTMPVP